LKKIIPLALLVTRLLSGPAAFAQSLNGSIAGDLSDGSGKPVSGVTVTLTSEDTARTRTALSDSRGEFVISVLAPGWRRLEGAREGFRKYVQRLDLGVDQEMTVDIPLIGSRKEEDDEVTALRANTGIGSLGFGANDRPNINGVAKVSSPSAAEWFNPAAFAPAPYGSFGNAGRNILEGPGLATINVSLVKNTRIAGRMNLQFRVEAFKLFNRTNFDSPDIFLGDPAFGLIESAAGPRHIQFGLKVLF
jgi:hypothetical protein